MDSDEQEIFDYLKTFGEQFVAAREVCRRAGGRKKWDENPRWALPLLTSMEEKEILESDSMAHYRIKQVKIRKKEKHWLAPHIKEILEEGGVDPDQPIDLEATPKASETKGE
jgi:hypothetical protein